MFDITAFYDANVSHTESLWWCNIRDISWRIINSS